MPVARSRKAQRETSLGATKRIAEFELPSTRKTRGCEMRLASVVLRPLLGAALLVPSVAGAAPVRHTTVHTNHRHAHPVRRPAHPIHRPAHPVHRPAHRPAIGAPVARRTVVIGSGYRPVHPWWRPGGDRLRRGDDGGRLGGSAARARLLLVLHRPNQDKGFLGPLSAPIGPERCLSSRAALSSLPVSSTRC